jgi:ribonuclease BN (tRNA processing enzyme)
MLDIILLGTGGTQPLPERALAAACITVGGSNLLLDCGEGTQTAARRAGVSIFRMDAILLTHYHGDHIFGLPGIWVLAAVTIGGGVGGLVGVLLSVPVASVLYALLRRDVHKRLGRRV